MSSRYFTVEEANKLLPEISALMETLQARRANVIESRQEMVDLLARNQSDVGGPVASALVQDFIAIETLAQQIRSYGCIIKDLNTGLVDFLSRRGEREVYVTAKDRLIVMGATAMPGLWEWALIRLRAWRMADRSWLARGTALVTGASVALLAVAVGFVVGSRRRRASAPE